MNLDHALDIADQLNEDQKLQLIDILNKRITENKRDGLINASREALEEYRSGKITPEDATDIIKRLNTDIEDPGE